MRKIYRCEKESTGFTDYSFLYQIGYVEDLTKGIVRVHYTLTVDIIRKKVNIDFSRRRYEDKLENWAFSKEEMLEEFDVFTNGCRKFEHGFIKRFFTRGFTFNDWNDVFKIYKFIDML